jgi:hypothetical protein
MYSGSPAAKPFNLLTEDHEFDIRPSVPGLCQAVRLGTPFDCCMSRNKCASARKGIEKGDKAVEL